MELEPTNRELAIIMERTEKAEVKEFIKIDKHFKNLNGQVGKNTDFRNKVLGGMAVITFIGAAEIIALILVLLKMRS